MKDGVAPAWGVNDKKTMISQVDRVRIAVKVTLFVFVFHLYQLTMEGRHGSNKRSSDYQ